MNYGIMHIRVLEDSLAPLGPPQAKRLRLKGSWLADRPSGCELQVIPCSAAFSAGVSCASPPSLCSTYCNITKHASEDAVGVCLYRRAPGSPPMQREAKVVNHGAEHLKTGSSACAKCCCCECCTSSWAGLRGVSAASLSASESERGLSIGASAPFAAILGAAKPLLAASQPGKRLK